MKTTQYGRAEAIAAARAAMKPSARTMQRLANIKPPTPDPVPPPPPPTPAAARCIVKVDSIRNRDRNTTCRSCRAPATRVFMVGGKPVNSTCERHLALNQRRSEEYAAREDDALRQGGAS